MYYFKQYPCLEEYEAGDRLMWADVDIYFFSNKVICSTLVAASREYVSHKAQLGDTFISKVP